MIDRVADNTGRLGPVGDSAAMAENILGVWGGDLDTMGAAARAHGLQFSWDSSMESLFGRVYPEAFARRAAHSLRAPARAALAA
jgi:alpha-1,6-mannosyltransferase